MTDAAIVDILNDLLDQEQRGVSLRVAESTTFVSDEAIPERLFLDRLIGSIQIHSRDLVDAIVAMGGEPAMRRYDAATADLHFQDLRFVLARIESDLKELVRRYSLAGPRVADSRMASSLVGRNLAGHQAHLSELQRILASQLR